MKIKCIIFRVILQVTKEDFLEKVIFIHKIHQAPHEVE